MIETVVGSHSRIAMPPGDFPYAEGVAKGRSVESIFSILSKKKTWDLWHFQDFEPVFDMAPGDAFRAALILYADSLGKDIAGAKAPHSEFFIEAYQEWLEGDDLKFIHVVRNPFDVMASIKHSHIHTNWKSFLDLIDVQARNWVRSVSAILARASTTREKFFVLRYEDFVSDPVTTGKNLCSFIGVEFEEERMLNRTDFAYHHTNTSFPEQYAERADKNTYIYAAKGRKHLLNEREIQLVSDICGEMAMSLGYEDPDFSSLPPEQMARIGAAMKIRRLPGRIYRRLLK